MIQAPEGPLVVVDDFDVVGPTLRPAEAQAVLVIDTNAMLSFTVAMQLFQVVARGLQVLQFNGLIKTVQLHPRPLEDVAGARATRGRGALPVEQVLRSFIPERPNHGGLSIG